LPGQESVVIFRELLMTSPGVWGFIVMPGGRLKTSGEDGRGRLQEFADQHHVVNLKPAFAGEILSLRRPGETVDAICFETGQRSGRAAAVNRLAPDVGNTAARFDVSEHPSVGTPVDDRRFGHGL